jgi:hypothetical protein
MNGKGTSQEYYLELTTLLIDREIAKFRRGEQAAAVSFANVAKLARSAYEELAISVTCERSGAAMPAPGGALRGRSLQARGRGTSAVHAQAPEF